MINCAKKKKNSNIKNNSQHYDVPSERICFIFSLQNNQEKAKTVNIPKNVKCKVDTGLMYVA